MQDAATFYRQRAGACFRRRRKYPVNLEEWQDAVREARMFIRGYRSLTIDDDSRPDISRADFTWCRTAYQWGHSEDEIAAQLADLSECARKDGQQNVSRTVKRAAASVDRERQTAKPGTQSALAHK